MKKKMGIITLLLLVIFLPTIVYAQSFTTTLNGVKTASTNDKIDFVVGIKSDIEAVEFEATLKYDTSILELSSINKEESWSGNNSIKNSGNSTIKFTNNGTTGESSVVKLRFKVKSSSKSLTTITLDDIKLTVSDKKEGENKTVLTHESIKKDIVIKSDDNTLKSIKIDNKLITGFNSNVYAYTIEVDALNDSIDLSAVLNNNDSASFEDGFGSRKVNLNYGENTVLLKVKSESGKVRTYTLKIIRKDDRAVNNDLKTIIINGGKIKIKFDKNVLSYTVKTYKLDKIEIDAEADDSTSKVVIDAPKNLVIGDNKAKITVTASNGSTKVYNLLIVNSEVPTDTRLKNLSVKGENIGFESDKYNYTIRYDKSYKKGIKIYNTTLSNDVEVEVIGNENLKEGSKIRIVVTALDGSGSSEYTITLEKDKRVNFFLIVDLIIGTVLIVLIIIQLRKKKKHKEEIQKQHQQEELEKTIEIKL